MDVCVENVFITPGIEEINLTPATAEEENRGASFDPQCGSQDKGVPRFKDAGQEVVAPHGKLKPHSTHWARSGSKRRCEERMTMFRADGRILGEYRGRVGCAARPAATWMCSRVTGN